MDPYPPGRLLPKTRSSLDLNCTKVMERLWAELILVYTVANFPNSVHHALTLIDLVLDLDGWDGSPCRPSSRRIRTTSGQTVEAVFSVVLLIISSRSRLWKRRFEQRSGRRHDDT